MPRKKELKTEEYYAVFPSRIRKIMEDQGKTQQAVAEFIGKTRQAVGYYCDGSSSPDWKTIVNMARCFEVSTDYLLGLTDNPTTDPKIREICEYTGLSEKAVEVLNSYENSSLVRVINELIEQEEWIEEIDDVGNTPILRTIASFLEVKRDPQKIYQIVDGDILEKKSLIVRASSRDIRASDVLERIWLSDIETMLKELKEKHLEK